MKILTCNILILAFAVPCFSQTTYIGQKRMFTYQVPLTTCSFDGHDIFDKKNVDRGVRFTIIGQAANSKGYIISLGKFDDETDNTDYNFSKEVPKYDTTTVNGQLKITATQAKIVNDPVYYLLPTEMVENISLLLYPKWSPQFGALTFPFKYRPQSGVFEPTFSVSAAGGVKWDPWETNQNPTFSLLLGIGASSVQEDSNNSTATTSASLAAVTLSLSFMVQWQSLQLGISSGIDNVLSGNINKWKYQGKGWLSIGIGIAIFTSSTTGSSATDNKASGKAGTTVKNKFASLPVY